MDEIENIKRQIVRSATEFIISDFNPSNSFSKSWIGKVYLYKNDEEIPKDSNGVLMIPLMQLNLENLVLPEIISDSKVITVFVSEELPMDLIENGQNWLLREYKKSDSLTIKKLTHPKTKIKSFPLKTQNIDQPVWDGGDLTSEIEDKIIELENSGIIEDYHDVTENYYGHKLGGYPSFCQPGIDFGNDFEFIFQIASDDKANLNFVDSGTLFFAKNRKTGEWRYYCDFY